VTTRHLLLTYDFPPMGGGIARLTGELASRYPASSLLISTGSHPRSALVDSQLPNRVDRIGVQSRRLRTLQGLVLWTHRAGRLARDFRPGFVWCGNLKPAAYPALWVRRRSGTPYGIMVYGSELLLLQQRIPILPRKRAVARLLFQHAAVVMAISDWTRQLCLEVLDDLGLRNHPEVRKIPLGTDPHRFHPGIDTRAVRARYRLDGRRWLVTVARLVGHKGADTGLRVMAALRDTHPDLGYLVVGSGPQQPQLEALAGELGVRDRVRFLTDVPDDDLPALYNCAEIYLGLSRPAGLLMEGFGISLVEASASGIPVVAGRAGGVPDAVEDGVTGFLVDSSDPATVVESVRSVLGNTELALRLGRNGRRAVEEYFNWDRVAAEVRKTGDEFCRRE
jgi:phosphatidyl-myo-inositol dimannoside synthase